MNRKEIILFCLILFTAGLFIYLYLPGYSRYQELRRKEEKLLEEIESLKSTNKALELEFKMLQDDVTYLERVMRDEMGLAKPGEEIYKIVEEPAEEIIPTTNTSE